MTPTERSQKPRIPLLSEVVDLDAVRRQVEKLSPRQIIEQLNDSSYIIENGSVFKIYRVEDKLPITLLLNVLDCPWSIVTALQIAEKHGENGNVLYIPIREVHGMLYGKIVHEKYLTHLENELGIPVEVSLEEEVQINGKTIRIVGRADALIPGDFRITVLEVKSTCKIVPKHIMQLWAYTHMLNRYVEDKIAKPLLLTPKGFTRLDRYYAWNDVVNMVKLFLYILEKRENVPWDHTKTCPKARCPYYPWCPKAAKLDIA